MNCHAINRMVPFPMTLSDLWLKFKASIFHKLFYSRLWERVDVVLLFHAVILKDLYYTMQHLIFILINPLYLNDRCRCVTILCVCIKSSLHETGYGFHVLPKQFLWPVSLIRRRKTTIVIYVDVHTRNMTELAVAYVASFGRPADPGMTSQSIWAFRMFRRQRITITWIIHSWLSVYS